MKRVVIRSLLLSKPNSLGTYSVFVSSFSLFLPRSSSRLLCQASFLLMGVRCVYLSSVVAASFSFDVYILIYCLYHHQHYLCHLRCG